MGDNNGGALDPLSHVRFKEVDAGWGYTVGLSMDGTLRGRGSPQTMPNVTQPWSFASQGWTQHGNSQHYYVPGEHFKSIAAAASLFMALKAGS